MKRGPTFTGDCLAFGNRLLNLQLIKIFGFDEASVK